MSTITTLITQTIDLDRGVGHPQPLYQRLIYGNDQAHTFRLRCTRKGAEALLVGTDCIGYVKRPDGVTIPVEGFIDGCEASITLTAPCYAVPGNVLISMELITGGVRATHGLWLAQVDCTTTDEVGGEAAQSISDAMTRLEAAALPDWDQNDPSMPDYIRGRTHYMQTTTIDCTGDLGQFGSWRKVSDRVFDKWMLLMDMTSAVVDTDGVQSTVSPVWSIDTEDNVLCSYGRINILQTVLLVVHNEGYALGAGVYVSTSAANPSVLSFTWGEAVPLDDMYIPNTIARKALLPPMDTTLTQAGSTADAKAVGDRLAEAAPIIEASISGKVAAVADSLQRSLLSLTLYGKTAQAGTPTPSAPVPLVNVGSGGTVTVTATGKNLLPDTEVADQFPGGTGNVYTAATTSGVAVIGTVRLLAGVTYTLSATRVSGSGSLPCLILRAADGTNFESNYGHTAVPVTYTPSADVDATVLIQGNGGNTATTIGDSYAVQLEIGSAATSFEAYKDGYSASFSTPNGLPGIPVSTGGNYTDENGQQWLCDEIIWPEMKYVQRVVRLTGFTKQNNYGSTDAYVSNSDYPLLGGSAGVGLCNVTNVYKYNTLDEIHFYMSDSRAVVFVPTDFSGSIEVLAALAEPIETTPELVIYQSLASKYPNTTIINDGGVGMAASYIADTKNYIDQRIAAIAAAMINA